MTDLHSELIYIRTDLHSRQFRYVTKTQDRIQPSQSPNYDVLFLSHAYIVGPF